MCVNFPILIPYKKNTKELDSKCFNVGELELLY